MRRIAVTLLEVTILLLAGACCSNQRVQPTTQVKAQGIGAVKSDVLLRNLADSFLQTPEDYQSNNNRYLFIAQGGGTWINVDGENIELEQNFEEEKTKRAKAESDEKDWDEPPEYKVGDIFKETYRGKDLKAQIDFKVTELRPHSRLPAHMGTKIAVVEAAIKIERQGNSQQVAARGIIN